MSRPEPNLVHRAVDLAPEPASVRRARHAVTDTLRQAGVGDDATDTAALLVTELVTNAIVHARSSVGVTVTVDARGVLVEVSDHSPHLPVQRMFATESTTGRGLELLSLLATEHGARRTEDGGKVVWFTLGRHVGPETHAVRAAPTVMVTIELRNINIALFRTFLDHAASLLREHLIICLSEDGVGAHRAALRREADEAAEGNDALTLLTEATSGILTRSRGTHADAVFAIPRSAVGAFVALDHALDRAVVQAAQGLLLAPPSQPELRRLRTWCLGQIVDQSQGAAAETWEPLDASMHPTERARPAWDDSAVRMSDRAVLAADDANRILAVSPSAAALLGWSAHELVGRRVVTIIPRRFHEAHVAGFVHFLLTGERRMVGRDARLPALRRDGREIPVVLHIEPERLPHGRTVLVASIEPDEGEHDDDDGRDDGEHDDNDGRDDGEHDDNDGRDDNGYARS